MVSNSQSDFTKKQQAVIQAASVLFAEKGYANTSTKEIADSAHVSEGSIFKRFHSKKELLLLIINPLLTSIFPSELNDLDVKTLNRSYATLDNFISILMQNRIDYFKAHMIIFRIVFGELVYTNEIREQILKAIPMTVLRDLRTQFKDLQDRGLMIKWPAIDILRFMLSPLVGYFLQHYILFPQDQWDAGAEEKRMIDYIVKGLTPD